MDGLGGAGGSGTRGAPEGSPEAAKGFESSRGYRLGRPGEEPERRPGCLRTVVSLVLVLVALLVLFIVLGGVLHLFG